MDNHYSVHAQIVIIDKSSTPRSIKRMGAICNRQIGNNYTYTYSYTNVFCISVLPEDEMTTTVTMTTMVTTNTTVTKTTESHATMLNPGYLCFHFVLINILVKLATKMF